MKNKTVLAAALCMLFLPGCFTGTTATITEYDIATGKVVKVTQTGESIIKSVTASTKDKSVITWESGWNAYIHASTATAESPTPTFKMGVEKTDKGKITIHKNHKDFKVAEIIKATRSEVTVSPTSGVMEN